VWPVMTLFIPPTRQRRDDPKIVRWFDES